MILLLGNILSNALLRNTCSGNRSTTRVDLLVRELELVEGERAHVLALVLVVMQVRHVGVRVEESFQLLLVLAISTISVV